MKPPRTSRTLAVAGLYAILAQVAWGQAVDVTKDARLQKPISIKLKICQLPEAIKQLSKACGIRLATVATVNDLKVTILVRDEPAGLVLDKVAKVLGLEWKAEGDQLRIGMDNEERLRRDKFVDAEEKAAQKEIETEINLIASLASIDPSTAGKELSEQLAAAGGHTGLGSSPNVAYDPQRVELLKRAQNPQDILLGRFLFGLNSAKVSAFWRGDIVGGNAGVPTIPNVGANPSGGPVASGNPSQVQRPRRPPMGTPLFAQFDPLLYQMRVAQGGAVRTISKRPSQVVTEYSPSAALAKMPFGKEVLDWDQPVPQDGDLSKANVNIGAVGSQYSNRRQTVADMLETAFDQTHTPIVADAFRVPTAFRQSLNLRSSLAKWLNTFKQDNHLFTRLEDGVVMVRHGGFWRLRKFETPEELLLPFEQKAAKSGLTLDDYAALVGKLSPEQLKPFEMLNGVEVTFDTKPIESAYPALIFYATLDSQAVAQAMQSGIGFMQLRSAQRQPFIDAAMEGIFLGAAPPSFGVDLMRLSETGDGRGLGFLMRKEMVEVRGTLTDGQALLFGINLSQASTYKIPLSM